MVGPLTYLDLGVIALCVISGLLAMYRGLVREVLSIASWVLAALAGVYFGILRSDLALWASEQFFKSENIARVAVGLATALVVLIIVHFITMRISDTVLESRIGMIDRIFGLLFGVVRGVLLVAIFLAFLGFFIDKESDYPTVITDAQSYEYLKPTSLAVRDLAIKLRDYVEEISGGSPFSTPGGGEGAPAEEAPAGGGQSG
jgi:membrane protein required for colicin V production